MRFMFVSAISLMAIFFAVTSAQASNHSVPSNKCGDLVSEMQLLRKAQNQIIVGLAENHISTAKSLDNTSTQMSFYNKPAPMRVIHNMKDTANALNKRGEKGLQQAQTLDEATADLATRIAACLHK